MYVRMYVCMYVFIKPPGYDQQNKTCHGEGNNQVNIVILLILLASYPTVVETSLRGNV
jgi:hypothetical protein